MSSAYRFGTVCVLGILALLNVDRAAAQSSAKTLQGKIEIAISDDFQSHRAERLVHVRDRLTDKMVQLRFPAGTEPAWVKAGAEVRVTGRGNDEQIDVESLEPLSGTTSVNDESTTVAAATPGRTIAVLLLNMTDGAAYASASQVEQYLFAATQSTNDLYNHTTRGLFSFSPDANGDGRADIFGPFNLNVAGGAGCSYSTWASAANSAATAAGINLSGYQHVMYVLPSSTACGWWGLGSMPGRNTWVRAGGTFVYAHELGHNLGMHHAGTDGDNNGTIDSQYGDHSCVMGNNGTLAGVNAPHLFQLGLYSTYANKVVTGGAGRMSLSPLDLHPMEATSAQIIRLAKPNTSESYWLSYRRPIEYGARLSTNYTRGVNIHAYRSGSVQTRFIRALAPGETFTDSANGLTVTAVAQNAVVAVDRAGNVSVASNSVTITVTASGKPQN